jgi:hypothetical protein
MTHTYEIDAPWSSAMTQGEAASLFVRAARGELAARVVQPLFESPLSVTTPEGPVLQEYPTTPPAHVLNGWIYGLWGLYDVALSAAPDDVRAQARSAFDDGVQALAARVDRYDTLGWSRYDLYPHPIAHVASPYYHRLHVELLRALDELAPDARLRAAADRWERTGARLVPRSIAVARKVAFRLIKPRRARQTRRS